MNRFAKKRIFHAKASARAGKRRGVFFRSRWENNVALWLDELKRRGEVLEWSYEKFEFEFKTVKRGVRFYRPDFFVKEPETEYFIEVKGYMDKKSVTALVRMQRHYPDTKILIMDKKRYEGIASEFGNLEGWEN